MVGDTSSGNSPGNVPICAAEQSQIRAADIPAEFVWAGAQNGHAA
jgi:hypothetical protein